MADNDKSSEFENTIDGGSISDGELHNLHVDAVSENSRSGETFFKGMPLVFLSLSMILIFVAGVYFSTYSKGFKSDAFSLKYTGSHANNTGSSSGAAAAVAEIDNSPEAMIKNGEKVFKKNCMVCHQKNGQGLPGAFPPLAGSEWVTGKPEVVAAIVLSGVSGAIEVNGTIYNGAMPGLGALSDRDIAGIVSYIRSAWGNTADAIDEASVSALREKFSDHPSPWTAEELKAF